MSRTIRRKNANHEYRWSVGRLEDIDQWDLAHYGANSPEQCLERKRARFHADRYSRRASPPRLFVRQRNRRLARMARCELHRCWQLGEWEDHLTPRFIRDAAWLWF